MKNIKRNYKTVVSFLLLFIFISLQIIYHKNGVLVDSFSETSKQNQEMIYRLKGAIDQIDPNLIDYIRKEYIVPPSKEPYNFRYTEENRNSYRSAAIVTSVIEQFYSEKKNGYFIEAGALDGEYMSHTLPLEKDKGWTGLLVEPDSFNFKELQQRHRKAWLTPSCLSKNLYPEAVILMRKEVGMGSRSLTKGTYTVYNEKELRNSSDVMTNSVITTAQCLPIASILKAINVSHIDLFILDVETAEEKVLSTFPFQDVTVDIWVIEHNGNSEDQNFVRWMVSKGFYYFDMHCEYVADYIFLRKDSDLYEMLKVPKEKENRTSVCGYKPVIFHYNNWPEFDINDIRDYHHWPQMQYEEKNQNS